MKKFLLLITFLSLFISAFNQTITLSSLSKIAHCQGDTVWFHYSTTGSFNSDNNFMIEIGATSGTYFPQPQYWGSKKSDGSIGSDSLMIIIPAQFPYGLSSFEYRIVSNSPVINSNSIDSIIVHSNPVFTFPSADTVYCFTEKATALSIEAPGYTALFYGDGISNSSFLPSAAGVGYHYIYCTISNIYSCSTTDSLKVTIISTPKPDLVISYYTTQNSPVSVSAFGTSIKWFTDSLLTNVISTNYLFNYTIPNNDTGIHYLYPTQTVNQCQSVANRVTVIYRPKIVTTICLAETPQIDFNSKTMCAGNNARDTVIAHKTKLSNIEWFDGANPAYSNVVSTDSVLVFTKQNNPGVWSYYAFEHDIINNCYSKVGAQYSFTVNPNPILSLDIPDAICYVSKAMQLNPTPSGGFLTVNDLLLPTYLYQAQIMDIKNEYAHFEYTYSDKNGCLSILDKKVYIKYTDIPTNSDATGYLDSIPELYASGTDNTAIINWFTKIDLPSFLTGEHFTPQITELGYYTYFVTQTWNGCSSDFVPVNLNITAGSKITTDMIPIQETALNVYPIPTNDLIFIKNGNGKNASIYSLQGIPILKTSIQNNSISLQTVPSGIYILKIDNGFTIQAVKIIKE
jgi:hypothetical protein